MDLPDKPDSPDSTPLSAAQRKAWESMRELLSDPTKADKRYDALPGSKKGRIISTDLARFLDTRYAKRPKKGQRDIKPGWGLAWWYAKDRFQRELRKRGSRSIVRFMAGGWAAGKTHALEHQKPCDLAWDGTLSVAKDAAEMIDLALSMGWKVEIAYVFRNLELAFYGAVERGHKEGRLVPLAQLPKTHRDVQHSILDLHALYESDTRVSFLLLHNLGTHQVVCEPLVIAKNDLEAPGGLHYTSSHEHYYIQAAPQIGQGKAPRKRSCR